MEIHQPHDKLFKETFTDLQVAESFMHHYLPAYVLEKIDLATLVLLNESFIQEDLRDTYSDLLYKVSLENSKRDAYFYFLYEHKSWLSEDIAIQLLGYIYQVYQREVKKMKAKKLPLIVPIVLYQGEKPWQNLKRLQDWIVDYEELSDEMKQFVPEFDILLYDFSYDKQLDTKGNPKLQSYLKMVQHIYLQDWEEIIEKFVEIAAILFANDQRKYFDTLTLYLFGSRDKVPIEKIYEKLTSEGRERFMTTAERLRREGKIEGEKRGEKRGERKRNYEIIKNALNLDMTVDQIVQLTGLDLEEVEKIIREVS